MARGKLRIYLGAAPGVGKTFAMLNEGRRRAARGTDVVAAYVETHGRPNTEAQIGELEVIPRQTIEYRGARFEEMDLDAVLARRPDVALVDELAHTNVPGSRHEKRWEDVEELLDAGIEVISTVNIQHLESMNDVVAQITGIEQRETIPDEIVRRAEQLELVDMSPEALRRRMAHGNIYRPEKVDAALANYFRVGNLGALRELALLWVADRVDEALDDYRSAHGITRPWETRERVVVALTGAPNGDAVIRRAARMAMRTRAELLGVHVRSADGLRNSGGELLADQRALLAELGGEYREVSSSDVAEALVRVAQAENATQLVLGASRRSRWAELTRGSVINAVLRACGQLDVHVISSDFEDEGDRGRVSRLAMPSSFAPLSRRRRRAGWALAIVGPLVLTGLLALVRDSLSLPSNLLIYLGFVVVVATVGGMLPAILAAVSGSLLANWFFTPPIHTFTIAEPENLLALAIFVAVAVVVSYLLSIATLRAAEAARARAEAETLAALAGSLAADDDPLPSLVGQVATAFAATTVAVLAHGPDGWAVEASTGGPAPARPEDAPVHVPIGPAEELVVMGASLADEDLEVLQTFADQLRVAVERRRLRAEADTAGSLAEANELRTALLAAVSHDLRTPLASIKASATSLLQPDVRWSDEDRRELLETIDEESDRLNGLVGNLLDMSRLQTGAVQLVERAVGLEEVVPRAIAGLAGRERVALDLPETLPRVRTDAALLERALANLVDNALAWSPDEATVRVCGGAIGDRVQVRVIDQGPGIPPESRVEVFRPFQRRGDRTNGAGVGLGLAVAKGFVDAVGGTLEIEDTPGGGVTMLVDLPAAGTDMP